MLLRRAQRAVTSWIAILALLAAALAPAVTHAIGVGPGAGWVEVCTAQGSRWMAAEGDTSSPAVGQSFEHCALCLVHAHAAGMPPDTPVAELRVPALAHVVPVAFLAAPGEPHAWVSAQPRAPPPGC